MSRQELLGHLLSPAGRIDDERLLTEREWLEGVMNSAEKPHWDGDYSVSSVLRQFSIFRISKPFLSKFITPSSAQRRIYV